MLHNRRYKVIVHPGFYATYPFVKTMNVELLSCSSINGSALYVSVKFKYDYTDIDGVHHSGVADESFCNKRFSVGNRLLYTLELK